MAIELKGWFEGGQIYFEAGKGFGLTPDLQTIYLGKEEDILKALNGEGLKEDLSSLQRLVLSNIIEEEKDNGTTVGASNLERAKPVRVTRYRKKNTRQIKARGRLPFHKAYR